MEIIKASTFRADVWVAGDLENARLICREYCLQVGLCVSLEPCDFIFTGGMESGVRVGLVNYPRFPLHKENIRTRAFDLAYLLMQGLSQTSALVVDDEQTLWLTRRAEVDARVNGAKT